jgi:hypothetical protein
MQQDGETMDMAMRLARGIGNGAVRGLGCVFAITLWCGPMTAPEAHGQAPPASASVSLGQLLRMSAAELEALYRQGTVVAIPEGRIRGTALLAPGTRRTRALSRGARLVWQGKVFEPGQATAVNRFFGLRVVRAQVYQGPSWLDGGPSLVLDYSQTSRVYAGNRDEIRQVAPGLFLGLMYDRTTAPPSIQMYFALEARP